MFMVRRSYSLLRCVVLAMLFAGCSSTGYSIADLAAEINATQDTQRTIVVVGDTVAVTFPFKAEWNHNALIRQDGVASFLLIDEVQIAGRSLADLDTLLTETYRKKRPQDEIELSVQLQRPGAEGGGGGGGGFGSEGGFVMFVIGEVQRPGPVPLLGRPLTLTEALSAAGGHLKATANLRNTILVRRVTSSGVTRSWRLDADIYGWGSQPPIFLQPRDIVFVPNTAIDDVNIWVDKYIRQMIPLPYLFSAP